MPDKIILAHEKIVQQPDAAISQANPVSGTLYTVLDTTPDAIIELVSFNVTWSVTQPTNLRLIVTVDGVVQTYTTASPVSGTNYYPAASMAAESAQGNSTTQGSNTVGALPVMSGKSVKIEVAITWATTQPTPLVCRVKYARKL